MTINSTLETTLLLINRQSHPTNLGINDKRMSSSVDHEDRQRGHACDSSDEHGGGESESHTPENRPGQAERKRQLERNRRNLINARFIELSAELQRSASASESPESREAPRMKRPRMDKEAVLKEATMRLIVQHKELSSASARLKDLGAQIDAMRAEMSDLRKDKVYLRSEVHRLRGSNAGLWKALHRTSQAASHLPPAREPAGLTSTKLARSVEPKCERQDSPSLSPPSGTDSSRVVSNAASLSSDERAPVRASNCERRDVACAPSQTALQGNDSSTLFSCLDDLGALFSNTAPARTPVPASSALSAAPPTSLGFQPDLPPVPASSLAFTHSRPFAYGSANGNIIG